MRRTLTLLAIAVVLTGCGGGGSGVTEPTTYEPWATPGTVLYTRPGKPAPVSLTPGSDGSMSLSMWADHPSGMDPAELGIVKIAACTPAEVIDPKVGVAWVELRDGPHEGEQGWLLAKNATPDTC